MAREIAELNERIGALERTRTIPMGSGAPTTAPGDGAQYGDSTNSAYYVRTGGAWKAATLGHRFELGTVSLPFTASATSSAVVVTHGLAVTPSYIGYEVFDLNADNVATVALGGTTTFTVQARYVSAVTGSLGVRWVAYA